VTEKWKQIGSFADGVVYANGNKRKLVIPNNPEIYFELDTKKVWWQRYFRRKKDVDKSGTDS
jgi:hypothetical protein